MKIIKDFVYVMMNWRKLIASEELLKEAYTIFADEGELCYEANTPEWEWRWKYLYLRES